MNKTKFFLAVAGCFIVNAVILNAAEYYVSSSQGNDSNPGAFDKPWKTIEKVNSFIFQTGDDVYFRCGDTFTPTAHLNVDWEGTAANPAVIGAYYISGGQPVLGVLGPRPVISGSDWTVPGIMSYKGLINIEDRDYIHIENMHIYRSGFYGVYVRGDPTATKTSYGFVVTGCRVESSWAQSILTHQNPSNYGTISDNEVTDGNKKWVLGDVPDWGGVVVVLSCPTSYTTIKNNFVFSNYGEGISSVSPDEKLHCGYATIENNVVFDNRALGIYVSRTENNVIRNNIVLGHGDPSGSTRGGTGRYLEGGRYWNGNGIEVNNEIRDVANDYMSSSVNNNQVYNNLVAGTYAGLVFGTGWSDGSRTAEGNVFYNNTVAGCYYSLRFPSSKFSGYTMIGNEIKNNIFYVPSDGISYSSNGVSGDAAWVETKIHFGNNAWTGSKPTYAGDATDVILNNNFVKTAGWQDLSAPIGAENFKLISGNPAIEHGVVLAQFTKDYFGTIRPQGSAWDIGAHEFITQGGSAPPAPEGLSVK